MERCYNPSCPFLPRGDDCECTQTCERFCPTPTLVVSSNRTETWPSDSVLVTNTQKVLAEAKRINELEALIANLEDPFQDVFNRENLLMEYTRARDNHLDYLMTFIRDTPID